ncbi:MAG: HAD-IA family hydrolase [Candidatus Moraniibacteriota bacterium]|nr:MAG: HAD-IA family hydrolase [Candidatus Moranbacteria bacterium]
MQTSAKSIKAIVFDFGGVIQLFGGGSLLEDIANVLQIENTDFKQRYFEHNHLSHVKNVPWEQMIVSVVNTYNVSPEIIDEVNQLVSDYQSRRVINTELVSWFPQLKKLGYKIAILSNATTELRKKLHNLGIHKHIDKIVISGEIGFQKPHKEAFDVVFQKLGVLPQEVIFIDDAPKNLEKAAEIGYTPILFRGNDKLKEDLERLGINL